MVVTQTDLQNAADAAALAGAGQLMDGFVQYNLPGQTQQTSILSTATTTAKTSAKNYASYNGAGGVSSLVLLDSDIEFGFTDAKGSYTPQPTYAGYPNTVKVTLRRDSQANGPLRLFFGAVLGTPTVDLTTTAAATIYTATIDGFQTPKSLNSKILPVTYDVNHWNNFLQTGQGPDGTTAPLYGGAPQLAVFPSIKYKGNFGLLTLDQTNAGASTISNWIDNGPSASDLQQEYNAGLLPLSAHAANQWDWKGKSGLKASEIAEAQTHLGEPYLLPLFKPYDASAANYQPGVGSGNYFYYDIVQFVGVKITYIDSNSIAVQPCAVIDPNATFSGSPAPAGTSSSLLTTFAPPKLTQ
jgi:hypothetical protein